MGVVAGSPVSAANTNQAFLDANADDTGVGKYNLENTDVASGAFVTNLQAEVNGIDTYTGRSANSGKSSLPVWTDTNAGSPSDNLTGRGEALTEKFNPASGHTHDGTTGQGPNIVASTLASVPLKGYVQQGLDLVGVTGTSTDVSTELTGKVPSSGATVVGVVVTNPLNKLIIRQASGVNENDVYTDAFGNVVYARLTESAGVWTLSYFVDLSGTETAYSFALASDVRWYYQELFNPMVNPPVYSEFANIPSDNVTADVVDATTSTKGKTLLSSSAPAEISATGSAGTANATVANADHTHKGVHNLGVFGDATKLYGDVDLEAGTSITLTRTGQRIKIDSAGSVAFQEIPSGVINGVNPTFGPLTFAPSDVNSVLVFIDFVAVPITTGFTITGSTITFQAGWIPVAGQSVYAFYLTAGTPSVPVVSGTYRAEYRTVTPGEASAKQLTLANTPATPSYVSLDVIGGGPQFFGDDFTVVSNVLDWNGLGLDGFISTGDRLRITYVE